MLAVAMRTVVIVIVTFNFFCIFDATSIFKSISIMIFYLAANLFNDTSIAVFT